MGINRDFRDLLFEFNAREVRYLVVGGYAVSFHTKPRYTKDIDFWVDTEPSNARKTWESLGAFGAPLSGVSIADFGEAGTIFQVGQPPNRIDVLTRLESLSFEDAWAHRVEGSYGDQKAWFLSRDHLIRNKRAVGRPQDLADADMLEYFGRLS
jgi:hypothetical protein